jgi:energy-coupling factor transporter ATP-binding protein EcfA2
MTAQKKYTPEEREEAQRKHKVYQGALEDYDLETAAGSENLIILDQTIVRLELENFRVFERLDIDLTTNTSKSAPWSMLLGENGCGKSSILQAVAMALAGEKLRHQLAAEHRLRPMSYVRRGTDGAVVRVHVAGLTDAIELRIDADGTISGTASRPRMPILGYGATRLLPGKGTPPAEGTRYARITGLFDPFAPLADATSWLLSLPEDQFDAVARTLKHILNLDQNVMLEQNHDTGQIEIPWLAAGSLEELSAGYQSVVAMAVDIMKVMTEHFSAMEAARGIVLVDEVGAHLHPQWRMRIVSRLRAAFPAVQFLVTTHDPLCLRGLDEGEVAVLKKTREGTVFVIEDLPSVAGLRVDQLLTSEHFGLSSTIDPDLEKTFVRYQELLGQKRRSNAAEKEMTALGMKLKSQRMLGATRRERLMLAAIDRFLGRERRAESGDERDQFKRELDDKLIKILESTD